jgi:putative hemolysin
MLDRTPVAPPRRLIDRFRPAKKGMGLLPTLKAYRGSVANGHLLDTLGRLGPLEVRLAQTAAEVRRAQKLRYRVFYQEGGALADASKLLARRDVDAFDAVCDHLLVIDHAAGENGRRGKPTVVGTYRLLRQEMAERHGGFYSAAEFDVGELVARHPGMRFLELGRSCVLADYRNKRTLELLWHGIGAYTTQYRSDVLIGCASLEGIDPAELALPLSYLHHFARAPEPWRAHAVAHRHIDMNRMAKDALDQKAALRAMPPLIKGYLRLGAYIGDGAVIDHQFGTTDVLIVLPVTAIKSRYKMYFRAREDLQAA